jgi:3-oxoacyl-[acyl-carrier protein] reductase
MQLDLTNKVALVTGASRGIGQAIVEQLAKQQAFVVGTATTQEGAARISARLDEMGLKGMGMALDVCVPQAIDQLLATMKDSVGAPDILVNNAGITRDNLLLRMQADAWDELMATNLTAVYRLSKACLRDMLKARWGRIVSIGSVVGATGNPGQANYAAAKAAVIGFSKSLAKEVAERNITVNVVAPGFIDTDMTRQLNDQQRQATLQAIPMQRLGTPQDIAAIVGFLVADAANYVTGQTIHVNGGMYMI